MPRKKNRITILTPIILIAVGVASLIASVIFASQILAFIGLGFIFWGAILTFIKTENYVLDVLLDATYPSLITIEQLLQELRWEGQGFYLPPKFLRNVENNKVYIPKAKNGGLPTPEYIRENENNLFVKDLKGMLLTSPGHEIVRVFEKTLGTSLITVDLEFLKQNIPKLFIEDLEIAQEVKLVEGSNNVQLQITNSVFTRLNMKTSELTEVYRTMGCPLVSAIASTIARVTGKPVQIVSQEISGNSKILSVNYLILENQES